MSLPTLSGTGRLTADPELKFAQSGTAICKVNLAFNARKKDDAGNWVDGDVFFVTGTLFKQAAENAAESLAKGIEVVVSGRLKTRSWQTDAGEKRSTQELLIDEIGPSIRWAQASVRKVERGQAQSTAPAEGPWATGVGPAPSDEPPF